MSLSKNEKQAIANALKDGKVEIRVSDVRVENGNYFKTDHTMLGSPTNPLDKSPVSVYTVMHDETEAVYQIVLDEACFIIGENANPENADTNYIHKIKDGDIQPSEFEISSPE